MSDGAERAAYAQKVLRGEITGEVPKGGWNDAFLAARARGDEAEAKLLSDSILFLASASMNPDLSTPLFEALYAEITAAHGITLLEPTGMVRSGWQNAAKLLLVK